MRDSPQKGAGMRDQDPPFQTLSLRSARPRSFAWLTKGVDYVKVWCRDVFARIFIVHVWTGEVDI